MNILAICASILIIFGISFVQEYTMQEKERKQLEILMGIKNEQIRDMSLILFLEQHPGDIRKSLAFGKFFAEFDYRVLAFSDADGVYRVVRYDLFRR